MPRKKTTTKKPPMSGGTKAPPTQDDDNDMKKVSSSSQDQDLKVPPEKDHRNHQDKEEEDDDEDEEENDEWKVAACCLCHCGLDYSDRAAFFKADREEDYSQRVLDYLEQQSTSNNNSNNNNNNKDQDDDDAQSWSSYFFRPTDPYLPSQLYDKHNALVYCDGCNRMYHQKCHFVPLIVLPKKSWKCLVCQSLEQMPLVYTRTKRLLQQQQQQEKPGTTAKPTKGPAKAKGKAASKQQSTSRASSSSKRGSTTKKSEPTLQVSTVAELEAERHQWMTRIVPHQSQLFVSPPVAAARPWEEQWESLVRDWKLALWQTELSTKWKQALAHPTSTYRLAETAATALTSTQKNRSMHIASSATVSQELAQTLVRLYGARLQFRDWCFHLDAIRRSTNTAWHALHQFCRQTQQSESGREFVERVLFPFGTSHKRRIEPRTAEMKKALLEQNDVHAIPMEIFLPKDKHCQPVSKSKRPKSTQKTPPQPPSPTHNKGRRSKRGMRSDQDHAAPPNDDPKDDDPKDDDPDSDGVTLDNLQCCICHTDHATDENDLVMCDGIGCYRAFHMKCVKPALTMADVEQEDDDWFCPLCRTLSQTLLSVQVEYMGEEWEQERYEQQYNKKSSTNTDTDSHKSWDKPHEVFPTAEQDYAAACQMKQGLRNKATDDLIARILGVDQLSDHDSDDEVEDGHFDLDSFQRRRRRPKVGDTNDDNASSLSNQSLADDKDDDESSHSSQATLVEMSSVELEIGKGELDALSKASSDEEDDDDEANDSTDRRRRRRSPRRRVRTANDDTEKESSDQSPTGNTTKNGAMAVANLGDFNEGNIIQGKRGRKPVDYIRLNEAIFGHVSDREATQYLDDADDHHEPMDQNTKEHEQDSDNNDSDSDNDQEEDDDNDTLDKADDTEHNDDEGKVETSKNPTKRKQTKGTKQQEMSPKGKRTTKANSTTKDTTSGANHSSPNRKRRNGVAGHSDQKAKSPSSHKRRGTSTASSPGKKGSATPTTVSKRKNGTLQSTHNGKKRSIEGVRTPTTPSAENGNKKRKSTAVSSDKRNAKAGNRSKTSRSTTKTKKKSTTKET